jgi:hypothetical protein
MKFINIIKMLVSKLINKSYSVASYAKNILF